MLSDPRRLWTARETFRDGVMDLFPDWGSDRVAASLSAVKLGFFDPP